MNEQERDHMRIWRHQQRTPEERIDSILSMCVYATVLAVILLIGAISEALTLFDYWRHGVPSHPEHSLWVDILGLLIGLAGGIGLAIAALVWLAEAGSIHKANQSFRGKPPK
jgi:hypothetical protein